jgi:hypothetical protein
VTVENVRPNREQAGRGIPLADEKKLPEARGSSKLETMKHGGKVKNGVVVLDAPFAFKEGEIVAVERIPDPPSPSKLTREQVLNAIEKSPLRFTKSWDEIKKETR